jgi:uncharacterized protein (DUF2164 family)
MNNWTAVAVIIAGYAVGVYFQNKRIDDLKSYIDARLKAIEDRLDKIEARLDRLEQKLEHPVVRP